MGRRETANMIEKLMVKIRLSLKRHRDDWEKSRFQRGEMSLALDILLSHNNSTLKS